MKKYLQLFCIAASFLTAMGGNYDLTAQTKKSIAVTGKVTDLEKEPLAGVVVAVKGTTNNAMTGSDGTYTISAAPNDVLIFSSLGFADREEPVNSRSNIDVIMETTAYAINEAVVEVGYGSLSRKDITGTVAVVDMKDALKAPVVSFDQALQGRVAGVQISSGDGTPGAEMDIVIRGANSLTQSNSPLYVVDGFPMEDFSSSAVSSADIASISVLKDASATAIYGARGANGVVIIETNKGQEGRPVVTYNGTYGVQTVAKQMELMSAAEFVMYQVERDPKNVDNYFYSANKTLKDYEEMGDGANWQAKLFRPAAIHMHNLSITGGSNQTKYSASLSMADQDGVIICSGYEKYQGRMSFNQKLGKTADLTLQASYTQDKVKGQTTSAALDDSNAFASYLMYRTWAYRPVVPGKEEEDIYDDFFDGGTASGVMNPIISTENEQKTVSRSTFTANAKINWNILRPLKFTISGGFSKQASKTKEFNNSLTYKGYITPNNNRGVNATYDNRERTNWMNEYLLTYSDRWNNSEHNLTAVAGFTLEGYQTERFSFTMQHIPNESLGISGMDEGLPESQKSILSENSLMSFLARINYSLKSRYMFTFSMRADGSSKFAKENRWGYFPSGAFAWRFSEEKWMKPLRFIDDAKIRVSYGFTGNNRIGDFSVYQSIIKNDYYSFGNNTPEYVTYPNSLGNKDLKWESTEQLDLGFDLRMFGSRVSLTLDWYRKITHDLLLNANLPYSTGYKNVYKNIGKVSNHGLEVTLNTVNVKTAAFQWDSDLNISFNRNKVLELSEGEENYLSTISFTGDFNKNPLYIAQKGFPMGQFFGYEWDGNYGYEDFDVDASGNYILKQHVPDNGSGRNKIRPGDIKYVDQNGDGVVNDLDKVVIGRTEPVFVGGFNNNFTYKNLSLNIFFQWSYGFDIMNANRIMFEGNYANKNIQQFKSYVDHWTPSNQDSKNFRVGGYGPKGYYSSRTIEDGSFLRLKTLQLSYILPTRWTEKIKIETIQISLAAQNLWTWTNYSGLDPEVSTKHSALTPNFDYSAYARNRAFTAGLKIIF